MYVHGIPARFLLRLHAAPSSTSVERVHLGHREENDPPLIIDGAQSMRRACVHASSGCVRLSRFLKKLEECSAGISLLMSREVGAFF